MTDQDKKIAVALKENLESTEFTNLHVRNVAISFFNEGVKAALAATAPTQPEPERDERAEFEAWAQERFIDLTHDDDGMTMSYKGSIAQACWSAWKGSRAALERK